MSYYKQHIFFCVNQREEGSPKPCCGANGATANLAVYAKQRLRELSLGGEKGVRITQSGCLGRCNLGPCVVIYPDNIWYRCVSAGDVDAIIDQHIVNGQRVAHLEIQGA